MTGPRRIIVIVVWSMAALAPPRGAEANLAAIATDRPGPLRARPAPVAEPSGRRLKIWQLGASLHCSIIGTCLSTGEFGRCAGSQGDERATKRRPTMTCTALPCRRRRPPGLTREANSKGARPPARAVSGASATRTPPTTCRRRWDDARRNGDIPGAYWAILTHPCVTDALVRRAFGDVHMLSHLVGSANRADIRRLHQLEEEKAALEDKLVRQQAQLRDGILARDAKIRDLPVTAVARIPARAAAPRSLPSRSIGRHRDAQRADRRSRQKTRQRKPAKETARKKRAREHTNARGRRAARCHAMPSSS